MATKICEICGNRSARYVCQECNRNVCERCLEPHTWLCTECYRRLGQEATIPGAEGLSVSLPLATKVFFIGSFLIFVGVIVLMIAALVYGLPSSTGLIILIWPIPIVLGAGEYSYLAIVLAAIFTLLAIIFLIFLRSKK